MKTDEHNESHRSDMRNKIGQHIFIYIENGETQLIQSHSLTHTHEQRRIRKKSKRRSQLEILKLTTKTRLAVQCIFHECRVLGGERGFGGG